MNSVSRVLAVLVLLLSGATTAAAQSISSYTTLASYTAALPSTTFTTTTENFSSVTTNFLMSDTTGDSFDGFSVVRSGSTGFGTSGYCPSLDDPQNSTPTSCVGYNSNAPSVPGIVGAFSTSANVVFTPTNKIFAFNFDFIDWNDGSQRSSFIVNLSDGSSLPVSGPTNPSGAPPEFFGFIVDEGSREAGIHITNIVWSGLDTSGELVGFWNIQTRFLVPEITTRKTFGTVILNADETIDVPVTIEVENTGTLNLDNFQLIDTMDDAANFSTAFTPSTSAVSTSGIISGPFVSVVDDGIAIAAVAPGLNPSFDGSTSNNTLFNGTSGALGPNDKIVVTFTVRLDPYAAGAPDPLQNVATASGVDPFGDTSSDISGTPAGGAGTPTVVTIPPSNPIVAVVKTAAVNDSIAGVNGRVDPGDTITYTYVISNTGNVNLLDISLAEIGGTFSGDGPAPTPIYVSGGTDIDGEADAADLAVGGGSITYTATYVIRQADINVGGVTNQASASGTARSGSSVSDASDESSIGAADNDPTVTPIVAVPSLTMVKTADDNTLRRAGDIVVYTYELTNTGNVPILGVTVNDVHNGSGLAPVPSNEAVDEDIAPFNDSTDAAVNGSWDQLAPGDRITFTGAYTVTQSDVDTLQ